MTENKMNIFQKMLAIESELGTVAKNLDVLDYKAVGERDVIDAVKPLEAKYGVFSYPVSRTVVDQGTMEFSTKNGTRTQLYMRIKTTYRFVNTEDPTEYIEVDTYGDGLDSADKSVGKAMTYADKYALMKAYKISTGDDPDAVNSKEYGDYQSKTQRRSDEKASDAQINLINKLFTAGEIDEMCRRQGWGNIADISKATASKMIQSRKK